MSTEKNNDEGLGVPAITPSGQPLQVLAEDGSGLSAHVPNAAPCKDEDFRLCYIRGERAYFTTQELSKQWGDDWNDAPYEHNAGSPYGPREGESWEVRYVFFDGDFDAPCEWHHNSPYSVDDINAGQTPWLSPPKYGKDHGVRIMAGTTMPEFRRLVQSVGGDVYEAIPRLSNPDTHA